MNNPALGNMVVSITDGTRTASIETSRDLDINDILTEIRGLLIMWGYHPDTVAEAFDYPPVEKPDPLVVGNPRQYFAGEPYFPPGTPFEITSQ